jgi:hypothetical protein
VLELRGFNLKTGQMVAANFGQAFPEAWQRTFEPLLDAVPARDFAAVRATVEAELGRPLGDVFATFDEAPLAAASIGQVHRATLRDGGARVVVKVMYPDVEARFRGDVAAAARFVAVALPAHLAPLREIEKQFANEFDYTREAAQLELVRTNLAKPRARGQADIAAIGLDLPDDRLQQGGFPRAVAPDQPKPAPGVEGHVRAFEQRAAANAECEIADGEHRHAGLVARPVVAA